MLTLNQAFDQQAFNRLGGQIKAGEVFKTVSQKDLVASITDHLSEDHYSGKLNYGISVYGWSERNLRLLLLELKKEFKRREVSSRFANQGFLNLSVAQHKGLLGGKELLVCKDGNDYHLAEVIAVQDIDAYSRRDFDKPFRDMKVGMLPPKLAQVMINLAGDAKSVWDPFCGGGVLIMEGVLMGLKMFGSDINGETLEGAQHNVDWIEREFRVKASAKLFVHDATKPLPKIHFDAIVCEGYLGPPQNDFRSRHFLDSLISELNDLYTRFFEALKKGGFKGPVVIAMPFFRDRTGDVYLAGAIKRIAELGYKEDLRMQYSRSDQLVGRDIFRFNLS